MPLEIIRNDITKVHADAIVNPANPSLLGGGGVDGAIHKAAGPELLEECKSLGGCRTGQAKITKGYNLPATYVIHTVGPIWIDGTNNEEKLLKDAYRNSLTLAKEYDLESVALPLISTGAYGYPKDQALNVAISTIGEFLLENDMLVYLVIYDKASFVLSEKVFSSITEYIDDKYIEEIEDTYFLEEKERRRHYYSRQMSEDLKSSASTKPLLDYEDSFIQDDYEKTTYPSKKHKRKLEDIVNNADETFSQMLLRLIDEKGMTDAETYKKANVDRRLFSKIRNDVDYKPSKATAIAFAIALELNLDQTKDLLLRAGYALSHSRKFDIIIEYFIENKNYNIFQINEALFAFDQKLLG